MEDIKKIVIFGTGAVAAEITSQLEDIKKCASDYINDCNDYNGINHNL